MGIDFMDNTTKKIKKRKNGFGLYRGIGSFTSKDELKIVIKKRAH